MEARFDYAKAAPGVSRALADVEHYLFNCGLEESLLNLVRLRASQITLVRSQRMARIAVLLRARARRTVLGRGGHTGSGDARAR